MKDSRIRRLEETIEKIKVRTYPLTMMVLRTAHKKRSGEKLTAREKRILKSAASMKIDFIKLKSNIAKMPKEKTIDERLKEEIKGLESIRDDLRNRESISGKK